MANNRLHSLAYIDLCCRSAHRHIHGKVLSDTEFRKSRSHPQLFTRIAFIKIAHEYAYGKCSCCKANMENVKTTKKGIATYLGKHHATIIVTLRDTKYHKDIEKIQEYALTLLQQTYTE